MNHMKVSVLFQSPSTTSSCFIQGVYTLTCGWLSQPWGGDNRQEARAANNNYDLAEKKTHKSLQGKGTFYMNC